MLSLVMKNNYFLNISIMLVEVLKKYPTLAYSFTVVTHERLNWVFDTIDFVYILKEGKGIKFRYVFNWLELDFMIGAGYISDLEVIFFLFCDIFHCIILVLDTFPSIIFYFWYIHIYIKFENQRLLIFLYYVSIVVIYIRKSCQIYLFYLQLLIIW
ncbi:hypothetical protein ACJX0J_016204, partial [Zea mays]